VKASSVVCSRGLALTATFASALGFGRRNLFNMIRFAEVYQGPEIVQTLSAQLSWSHFIEIIYLKDPLQRQFYAEIARLERWSVRTTTPEDPGHALREDGHLPQA
jgi:hypothetical protein